MRRSAAVWVLCFSIFVTGARAGILKGARSSGGALPELSVRSSSDSNKARQSTRAQTARQHRSRRPRLRRLGPPRLSGPAIEGRTLSSSDGSWINSPKKYKYAWQKCGRAGAHCTTIHGATSRHLTLTRYDVSHTVRVIVTASNNGGSTSATSPPTGVVSAAKPTAITGAGAVACALSAAAESCWASHTGVQGATGCSESQIESQSSGCGSSVFRHVTGDVVVSRARTTIDHEWISGCVSITSSATNVTIKDSLIATGDACSGGDGEANPSAINNGNSSGGDGLIIEDTTVDGLNTPGDTYGISFHDGECLRCNAFGFDKIYVSGENGTVQDSYGHNLNTNDACAHDNVVWFDSAQNSRVEHSYMNASGGQVCGGGVDIDGAISIPSDYGPPHNDIVANSYANGHSGVDLHLSCNGSTYQVISDDALDGAANAYADVWPTGTGNSWRGNFDPSLHNATLRPPRPPSC